MLLTMFIQMGKKKVYPAFATMVIPLFLQKAKPETFLVLIQFTVKAQNIVIDDIDIRSS